MPASVERQLEKELRIVFIGKKKGHALWHGLSGFLSLIKNLFAEPVEGFTGGRHAEERQHLLFRAADVPFPLALPRRHRNE